MVAQPVPPRAKTPSAGRVLLVEDNADGRETLRVVLQMMGFDVEAAEDGPSGVLAARSLRPDFIICDIGLPGLDGFQVARRVREHLGDSVRLVALTAFSDTRSRELAEEAGFDAFLVKPADLDELVSTIGGNPHGREPRTPEEMVVVVHPPNGPPCVELRAPGIPPLRVCRAALEAEVREDAERIRRFAAALLGRGGAD